MQSTDDTAVKRDGLADKRFLIQIPSELYNAELWRYLYYLILWKFSIACILFKNQITRYQRYPNFFLCVSSYIKQQNFSQRYKWTQITDLASFLSALLLPYPSSRENEGEKNRYYPYSLVFCSAWYLESMYIFNQGLLETKPLQSRMSAAVSVRVRLHLPWNDLREPPPPSPPELYVRAS